ncbi:hypothetical protein [Archangium sp.]|uniref:hypothetical protein n=1 Tax=Archangium sp. TaxID=1872627 RepID=UPI00389AF186
MSGRVHMGESPGSSWERGPSTEDVRRQLEGRLETVEAARARYASLESLLSGSGWKRHLREHPEALQAVLRQEPAFEEAQARIQRRTQTDQWPEDLPVLATVRETRALRARLEALVHKRLRSLSRVSSTASLVEALARLERIVLEPMPLEPMAGEVRVLEGDSAETRAPFILFPAILLGLMATHFVGGLGAFVMMLLLIASVFFTVARSGRFWLTNERFVWKPLVGEPVQIPLRSIPADGIRSTPFSVRVVGDRTLHLLHPKNQQVDLGAVLEVQRQPPLLGSTAAERLADVACYEATLSQGNSSRKGFAVLRPGYVAFLPANRDLEVLRAVTGVAPSPGVTSIHIPSLIGQLRYLPSEATFDACMERAASVVGAVRWNAWEVHYDARVPVWTEIRIQTDYQRPLVLSGKVDWSQQAAAERILADWPRR